MDSGERAGRVVTFYSYKGGVGRTMALANVAWILASNGMRVLIVDWDLESPGLHRYFHPFLVDEQLRDSRGVIDAMRDYAEIATRPRPDSTPVELDFAEIERVAQVQRYICSLEGYDFDPPGRVDLMPAGRQSSAYSTIVSTFDWDEFYRRLGGGVFVDALAADMRRQYDYVLIDSRTGLSDNAGICTVQLPDTVVACFTMSTQSIDGAAATARSIVDLSRRASRSVRIVPVPMRVEDGELGRLERGRQYARQRFARVLSSAGRPDPEPDRPTVEIPYRAFYAYEEVLATFGDPPGQEDTLLAAYERLAGELTGRPCRLVAPAEPVRLRWLAEFERRAAAAEGELVISYAPADHAWADWIAAELAAEGQPSVCREINETLRSMDDARRMLLLLSREAVRTPEATTIWRHGTDRDAAGESRFLVPVRLDGARMPPPFDAAEAVNLFEVPEEAARVAVLAALGLTEPAPPREPPHPAGVRRDGSRRPRFPATPPPYWRAPARNRAFAGRDAVLEWLRARLSTATTPAVPVAVLGLAGVGKTSVAIEFVHRFAADYDIVWWVSADQPSLVRTALADLAEALGLPAGDAGARVAAVREALRQGRPSPRWLVVFDNAGEPEHLRDFLPTGPGGVLVTSASPAWALEAVPLEIGAMRREESVALLSRRAPDLSPTDANDIAAKVGDLPLAVEQAAAWLAETAMPPREYLRLLDEHLPHANDAPAPNGYPPAATATWRLSLARLREVDPAAARLLELCAFFAAEPIPTQLVSSPRMIEILEQFDPALRDPMLHGRLLRNVGRFALARVDPAVRGIRVHRLVQRVIRDGLSPAARSRNLNQVREILATERRGEPDDAGDWGTYAGLRRHLEPTGMLEADSAAARGFVFDMVRYLRYRGDPAGALELAQQALASWERFGGDDVQSLRLRLEQANLLRAGGHYDRAYEIDDDVSRRLSRILGEEHPYALAATGGVAADLRERGEYLAARNLEERTLARWRTAFGDDHQRTLMTANNLAVSLRLTGQFTSGCELLQDTLRRQVATAGDRDYWALFWRVGVGRFLRETGDLGASHERLTTGLAISVDALGPDHEVSIWAANELTVTQRQLGDLAGARDRIEDALHRSQRHLGARHRLTLSCALERAGIRSLLGEHEPASAEAEAVFAACREALGDNHVFTACSANNFAVVLLRSNDLDAAAALLEDAGRLTGALPDNHPYLHLMRMNHATLVLARGAVEEAHRIDEECRQRLNEQFASTHPTVIAAAGNAALSLLRTGAVNDAQDRIDGVLRVARAVLGEESPDTMAIRSGNRIMPIIDPPPT